MVTNGLYGEVQDFNETSGTLLFSDEVPNPIDLVVHAYDGSGVLIAVAHQLNTTIVDGATYALTEWRPVGSWSVVVENFPPSMVVADGSSNFFTPNTPQWPLGGTQTNSGEDISAEHRLHVPGFASDLSTTMSVYGTAYDGQQDPPHYIVYCYEETLPPPGEVTVQLEAPSVIGNPTFDPATRTGTWTRLTAGTDDFVLFQVFTAAGPGGLVWRVRAPGSSTEVSFPSVPVDRPDLPTGPVGLDVWVSNERAATSYDELRALPQWELGLEAPYSSNYAASGASIPPP
jgi:hypothetical protein